MFLFYVTALCVLVALAGTGQLLAWVFRASKPAYKAGTAEHPLAVTQKGRHYRSSGGASSNKVKGRRSGTPADARTTTASGPTTELGAARLFSGGSASLLMVSRVAEIQRIDSPPSFTTCDRMRHSAGRKPRPR